MSTTTTAHKQRPASAAAQGIRVRTPAWQWRAGVLVYVCILLLLLVADVVALSARPTVYQIDAGTWRSGFYLDDVYLPETTAYGRTYRWTQGESWIHLGQIGIAEHAILTLELGSRPAAAPLEVTVNDVPLATLTADTVPRHYKLLLAPPSLAATEIGLHSPIISTEEDPRRLGVVLDGFRLVIPDESWHWPPLPTFLLQALILLVGQVILLRLGWRWPAQALVLGLAALGLAAMLGLTLLAAAVFLWRLLVAGLVLAALTWIALPVAERRLTWAGDTREIRLLWALALGAIVIRLVGVLYPTFGGQDLGLNLRRLDIVTDGRMVIIANSGEFGGDRTIYPPGPYLAVMPGLGFTSDRTAVLQGTLALLDGTTAFFVALIARRYGANRHAARMALVLYAGSIAAYGAMTYGFSAQIFGQWFTAPIALLLLGARPYVERGVWVLVTLLLLFGTLSHIGVAILGYSWIAFVLLILLLRPTRTVWLAALLWFASGWLAYTLLYVDIAGIMLAHVGERFSSNEVAAVSNSWLPGATATLWRGTQLAFTPPGLVLIPLGFLLYLWGRPQRAQLAVPLAALLTVGLYLLIDLLTKYQVRYYYFALPLLLPFFGLVLGRLAGRGRWGRLAAWALVLAIFLDNTFLWFAATFADGKISMTPLTH